MPRASFSHAAPIECPIEAVWSALQDATTWSGIGPVDDVWDAEHDEEGLLAGFRWSAHVGPTKYKGHAVVAIAEPPHHMKLNLDSLELSGSLIADVEIDEDPRLIVTLEVVAKGSLGTLFFPLIAEAVGRGLPEQVERFVASIDGRQGPLRAV